MRKTPPFALKCKACHYEADVSGKRFFDEGSVSVISTIVCLDCRRLSEQSISDKLIYNQDFDTLCFQHGFWTKMHNEDLTLSDEFWEKMETLEFKKSEEVFCLWCGSHEVYEWRISDPVCPKCESEMHDCSYSRGATLRV